MFRYLFDATDDYADADFTSMDSYMEHCHGFHSVLLAADEELMILLALLGFDKPDKKQLTNSDDFDFLYDLSEQHYPAFDQEHYDQFYQSWLNKTGRQASMGEYNQLVFVQGQSELWNNKRHRLVLRLQDC